MATTPNQLSAADIATFKETFLIDFDALQYHLDHYWEFHQKVNKVFAKIDEVRKSIKVVENDLDLLYFSLSAGNININSDPTKIFKDLNFSIGMKGNLLERLSSLNLVLEHRMHGVTLSFQNYQNVLNTSYVIDIFGCDEQMKYPNAYGIKKLFMNMVHWNRTFSLPTLDLNIKVPEIHDLSEYLSVEEEISEENDQTTEEMIDDEDDSETTVTVELPHNSPDIADPSTEELTPPYLPVSPAYSPEFKRENRRD